MSCSNCPPSGDRDPNPISNPADERLFTRLLGMTSTVLPEVSALLSSSCCWLPVCLLLHKFFFLFFCPSHAVFLTKCWTTNRQPLILFSPALPWLPRACTSYALSFSQFQSWLSLGVFGVKAWAAGTLGGRLFVLVCWHGCSTVANSLISPSRATAAIRCSA